jgi:hypothetical protein
MAWLVRARYDVPSRRAQHHAWRAKIDMVQSFLATALGDTLKQKLPHSVRHWGAATGL